MTSYSSTKIIICWRDIIYQELFFGNHMNFYYLFKVVVWRASFRRTQQVLNKREIVIINMCPC